MCLLWKSLRRKRTGCVLSGRGLAVMISAFHADVPGSNARHRPCLAGDPGGRTNLFFRTLFLGFYDTEFAVVSFVPAYVSFV